MYIVMNTGRHKCSFVNYKIFFCLEDIRYEINKEQKQRSCKYVYLFVYERSKSGDGNMYVYLEIS